MPFLAYFSTGALDLELVGEHRAVKLVLEVVGELVVEFHGVIAGPLAARGAEAAGRRPHRGAGTAEVPAAGSDFREEGLEGLCPAAEHDHVTGGAVHVREPGAVLVPEVHDLAKLVGLVVESAGLVDTHGVEMSNTRELLGKGRITADDAPAVPQNADYAAVLPVAALGLVGFLQQASINGVSYFFIRVYLLLCYVLTYSSMYLHILPAGMGFAFKGNTEESSIAN
jgi:hypothetical protein